MPRAILFLLLLLLCTVLVAQPPNDDCASATTLCAQQPMPATNNGAIGPAGFCPATGNVIWFTFTTNSVGGPVIVSVGSIDCPLILGMDNELSVVVLSGDGSCTPASFGAVSACEMDSLDFELTTAPLLPNTLYWVLVAGVQNGGTTLPAACTMEVTTSGPGADIVGVDFDAGPDQQIGEGESIQLGATGGTTYLWSPTSGLSGADIPDPIASPTETTFYTVTTQLNGCTYTDEVIVEVVPRIIPPNTFTPNDDGINDTWVIQGMNEYPDADVLIFDRWGQKVHTDRGYQEPWDGTNNGKKLPTATYYYHIVLNQLEGSSPPYTGSITIVR